MRRNWLAIGLWQEVRSEASWPLCSLIRFSGTRGRPGRHRRDFGRRRGRPRRQACGLTGLASRIWWWGSKGYSAMATVTKADLIDAVRDEVGVTHREAAGGRGHGEDLLVRHVHGARQGAAHGPEPEDGRAGDDRRHVVAPGRAGLAGDPARRLRHQTRARKDHRGAGAVVDRPTAFRCVRTPYCLLDIFSGADPSDAPEPVPGPAPACYPGPRSGSGAASDPSSASSRRRIAQLLICRPRSRHRRPKAARTTDTRPLRPRSRTYRGLRQWRARSP